MTTVILTALTLTAFAANSLLCRMALGNELIDPVSFTTLRLASGALALFPISRIIAESGAGTKTRHPWISGLALFSYAIAFSLAYVSLSAGMGALILFGAVQLTMIAAALRSGEKFGAAQAIGLVAAFGGLVYLVLPGITAPDPAGAFLMCISGIAWGVYSIRGKGASSPIAMTAANFARTVPMTLIATALAFSSIQWQPKGALLAVTSGVVTSGLGYVLWYKTLPQLTTTQASIVQLLVPVIAAFGGVALLSEQLSLRLIVSSALILGGVGLAITMKKQTATSSTGNEP